MHRNSRAAWESLKDFSTRCRAVYEVVSGSRELTDREVAEALGFSDLNAVRPRITELVRAHWLKETGRKICPVSGRPVRRVRALSPGERWDEDHQTLLPI